MSAAEAVETSVTNSFSQDYSNLDDQLPLKCTGSPGFKPFTLFDDDVTTKISTMDIQAYFTFKTNKESCFSLIKLQFKIKNTPQRY